MKQLLLVLFVVAMFVGCNGTPDNGAEPVSKFPMPKWFTDPPLEDGKAFFATGVYVFNTIDELGMAKKAAAARAREELAASMKAKIQSLLESYGKKVVTASGKKMFESFTMDVMRQMVNQDIYGAKIVKSDIYEYKGEHLYYTLVRVGFDGVSKALHKAAQEEFNKDPRPNAGYIDQTLYLPKTEANIDADITSETGTVIYSPENLNIDQTNKHLLFGFYDPFTNYQYLDRRLLPGEFVILEQLDDQGAVKDVIRIESVSYAWRSAMRDNNPNLKHQFYKLLNGSYLRYDTPEGKQRYDNLYPILTPYSLQNLKKTVAENPMVVWAQQTDKPVKYDDLLGRDTRLYNIWQAFIAAVPLHRQLEVIDYLNELVQERWELAEWLKRLENSPHIDTTDMSRRVKQILEAARRLARQKVERGQNIDKNGRPRSVKEVTRSIIDNFISKEEGGSLYRIVKEMKRWKRDQIAQIL